MTTQLPINAPEATPIGTFFSMVTCDGITTYFHYLLPFDRHCANDKSRLVGAIRESRSIHVPGRRIVLALPRVLGE